MTHSMCVFLNHYPKLFGVTKSLWIYQEVILSQRARLISIFTFYNNFKGLKFMGFQTTAKIHSMRYFKFLMYSDVF